MAIFWNIFLKVLAFFISFAVIITLMSVIISFVNDQNEENFLYFSGDKNSTNTIAIIELNGLIIDTNREFSELTNQFIISPSEIKDYLDKLKKISPKVIIFSINSPGGTVSASSNLYKIIKKFKKNNSVEIVFHTNELLASGSYWVSASGDGIYASYGSIIGSIGVRGPDWYYYDEPISISTGIFGNNIQTSNGIKLYSSKAGRSKDIFNPFREPTNEELSHLQKMVDSIYDDFIRIVSKERKIEINTIENDIGALIYTTKQAKKLHLIDDELNLNDLINKIIKEKKFTTYKVIKKQIQKNSLLREILMGNYFRSDINLKSECLSLRSSITAILSYQSTGC